MNITNIIKNTKKPVLYEKGNSEMWTDKHISKQLLNVHLNTEVDLGSRKLETINSTIEWVLKNTNKEKLNILDLGCGPGIYSEILTGKGHSVTGVDFSTNSIEYAKKMAEKNNLDIKYLNENYLELNLKENSFDLIILIFTDFGPLLPNERVQLLRIIKKALKPGGIFIFDVLNDNNIENKLNKKNWEVSQHGFWKTEPYLALSDSFLFKESKVILYQHTLYDENGNIDVYRFWTHFFSNSDLTKILNSQGFYDLSFSKNVLPDGDKWNGNNVTFCKVINTK